MAILDRLFSLSYWTTNPGPLTAAGWTLHLTLAGLFVAGLGWGLPAWRGRAPGRMLHGAALLPCLWGIGAIALRLGAVPGWSARVWIGAPAALAAGLLATATWLAPESQGLWQGWRALWAFQPPTWQLKPATARVLLLLHLVALTVTARLAGWPAWAALAFLAALLTPQLAARPLRRPGPASALSLNALLPLYGVAGLGVAWRLATSGSRPELPLGSALALLGAYAWAYQVYGLYPVGRRRALAWAPAALVAAGALGWAAWAYFTLYARGVTGTDPYCYIQMADDVMRHGTPLHRFALLPLAQRLQIDPRPILHLGYRLPLGGGEWASTVWPAGHSLLLGLAGRLAGQGALYAGTPLLALASIAAVGGLAALLFDDLEPPLRWLAGALAGLLVATSFEQLRWVLVHMADITAQLFSALTIGLAWLGVTRGRHRRVWLAAAGLALGLAYWARHTQLAMALPVLALLATPGAERKRRERALDVAVYLGAALLAALPDLAYHQALLGSPLSPESEELALYTLRAVPGTTLLLLKGWFAAPELGYLVPFLLVGALALARRNRRAGLVLGLWVLGLWAVQAPYASLRLRDLLPGLPALALVAGYGMAGSLAWLAGKWRTGTVLLALGVAVLLGLRTAGTAVKPLWRDFDNFGYLWATQRQEFADLQAKTEANAVIGAMLSSGPLDLYAGRETFRATAWRPEELRRFLQALWAEGRPAYLLDDGEGMAGVLAAVREYAQLTPAAALRRVPYYEPAGGSDLRDATLYRVTPLR